MSAVSSHNLTSLQAPPCCTLSVCEGGYPVALVGSPEGTSLSDQHGYASNEKQWLEAMKYLYFSR